MDVFRNIFIGFHSLTRWSNIVRLVGIVFHMVRCYFRRVTLHLESSLGSPLDAVSRCHWSTTSRKRIPNFHLSLFLSDLLGRNHSWWEVRLKYLEPYMTFEEWMIGELYGRGIVTVKYVGSYRETINAIHYSNSSSDIDMMYNYKKLLLYDTDSLRQQHRDCASGDLVIEPSKAPGYVYLRLPKARVDFVTAFRNAVASGEFHRSLNVESIMTYLHNIAIKQMDSNLYLTSSGFQAMHETFNRQRFSGWLLFKQEGPASNVQWNISGLPHIIKIAPLDMVFALHSIDWPKQAEEWPDRKRNYDWPSINIIKSIVAYGVDLVAKGSQTPEDSKNRNVSPELEYEWRLSFSVAETALVASWNQTQKCCYRFIKSLRYDFLRCFGIKSYYLKNIMFWLCEQTPKYLWSPQRLVHCSRLFLERLKTCCIEGVCPHYIMKDYNLMSFSDRKELFLGARKCQSILTSFSIHLWISDGLWYEVDNAGFTAYYQSLNKSLELIFEPHVKAQRDIQNIVVAHEQIFKFYYCSKVHKEVTKYLHDSLLKLHYHPFHVFKALWSYAKSKNTSQHNDSESELLHSHILFALLKGFRWYQHRTELGFSEKQGLPFNEEDLISEIRKLRDTHKAAILIYDSFLKGNLQQCLKVIFNADCDTKNASSYVTYLLKQLRSDGCYQLNSFPLFITKFDSVIFRNFKCSETAYYCPLDLFKLYIFMETDNLTQEHAILAKELLAEKHFSNFQKRFAGHYFKRFQSILKPFSLYMESRIMKRIKVMSLMVPEKSRE